jgi:hypothetical protein
MVWSLIKHRIYLHGVVVTYEEGQLYLTISLALTFIYCRYKSIDAKLITLQISHCIQQKLCPLYSSPYRLTPWCRTLFEKLIVTQFVKNILLSLWNPKVYYRVHKSPPLDPILSQPNPVRPIDPYLPKVELNVILPPTPRSSQWSLTYGPPTKTQ